MRFKYEVADEGKYYYKDNQRIYPEDFWGIIIHLDKEVDVLYDEVFRLRTIIAQYRVDVDDSEFLDVDDFLKELEKW